MQLTIYELDRQPCTVNLEEFHKDTISFGRHPESDIVMHPDKYQKISEQDLRNGENAHQTLEMNWRSARKSGKNPKIAECN